MLIIPNNELPVELENFNNYIKTYHGLMWHYKNYSDVLDAVRAYFENTKYVYLSINRKDSRHFIDLKPSIKTKIESECIRVMEKIEKRLIEFNEGKYSTESEYETAEYSNNYVSFNNKKETIFSIHNDAIVKIVKKHITYELTESEWNDFRKSVKETRLFSKKY